jgi:hypothetical protein
MAVKLGRKEFPSGYSTTDFTYKGRPGATPEGDYGSEVGVVDMACVNQFGDANNSKYFHGGVVQAGDGSWWCYFEWGRISHSRKSWNGSFAGGDFQFVKCSSEADARSEFAKKIKSKNTSRLQSSMVGSVTLWASKTDSKGKSKDGYIIQPLATRIRGLPDAYTIKDGTGVAVVADATPKPKKAKAKVTKTFHPEVLRLTKDLVGGVQSFTQRATAESGGIVPTLGAIEQVRNDYIPAAMQQIARIGDDVDKQIRDSKLIDISKLVAALVPRPIPRSGTPEQRAKAVILSAGNILSVQSDLDAFEAALKNEDFSVDDAPDTVDPDSVLNAKIDWVDPKSDLGRWVAETYLSMTRHRHHHLGRGHARIKGIYAVSRPRVDDKFLASVKAVAAARRGHRHKVFANAQPRRRPDCADISDYAAQANVFLGIHGTRPVNVAPIIQSDLRLPRQLRGVHISGAAFGHGIYWATDYKKSHGYTGHTSGGRAAYYGSGGQIKGRGFFMFLSDVIMGRPHVATSTGSWGTPPGGNDSVFAAPRDRGGACGTLANDEHITFNANYHRIRYIIEADI